MTTLPNPCCGFRFPAKVIEHAVWLYHPFSLSLREVALILDPVCEVMVRPTAYGLDGRHGEA